MILKKGLEWRWREGGATAYKTEGKISISFHVCPRNLILELISPGNRAMTLHKEDNFTLQHAQIICSGRRHFIFWMYKSKSMQVGLPRAAAVRATRSFVLFKEQIKSNGGCIPKYFGFSSAMGNFQKWDFFSVPVCFYCLAGPTPQLRVCPWLTGHRIYPKNSYWKCWTWFLI